MEEIRKTSTVMRYTNSNTDTVARESLSFPHVLLLFCLLIKKLFLAAVFEFVYTALVTKDKNIPVDNELPCKMNLLYRY